MLVFIYLLISFLKFLIVIIPVLVCVVFFTLLERNLIGYSQRRRGPNVVRIVGIFPPFADGLKLLIKEPIIPANANRYLYTIAPINLRSNNVKKATQTKTGIITIKN